MIDAKSFAYQKMDKRLNKAYKCVLYKANVSKPSLPVFGTE